MQVGYDTTVEEIADASIRAYLRSARLARMRVKATLWTALLTGMLSYLLLAHLGASRPERLIFGGLGVIFAAGGYWLNFVSSMRRRVTKSVRERMDSPGPIPFTMALQEDCILATQGLTRIAYDWGNLKDVTDAGDAIELHMRDGGYVIVRNKAFADAPQRAAFLARLRQGRTAKP